MLMTKKLFIVAAIFAVAYSAIAPAAAQNLLINGDFETGPYGDKDNITGWVSVAADEISKFDGIFDWTWKNPPPNPAWPTNYGPHSGSYYLGRYYGTPPYEPGGPGLQGLVYQQVTGLTPGQTLYGSLWLATHLPNGGGVRIGFDTDYVPDPEALPPPGPSATTVWFPPVINEVNAWDLSEGKYKKLQGEAVVGSSGNMTVWVQYTTVTNDIADAQIVQVDDVRLSTTKSMEIRNIEVYGINTTTANIVWDTYDGDTPLDTTGSVDYGTTSSYGTTRNDSTVRFNHSVNLASLVAGQTYHYRIRSTAPGYEDAQTVDLTFKMIQGPRIPFTNITVQTTTDSATISWDTDLAGNGYIDYGYTPGVYLFSAIDNNISTHHTVTLTNLLPNTPYYYRLTTCTQPPDGCRSYLKDSTGNPLYFVTEPGEFWNGDFEFSYTPTHTENEVPPAWTRFEQGWMSWFPSLKWAIPAQSGNNYVGAVTNGMRAGGGYYQRFATTPGEILSYSGWVWAEGVGTGSEMVPHRFGEQYCLIGIDPTGGINPNSPNVVWSARRQTLDWRNFMSGAPGNIHPNMETLWQKVGVATVAQGTAATIFLKADEMWPAGWNFLCFDNIGPEPITNVNSVAEAKELDNDVAINLAPAAAADCPVVTYIVAANYDASDNGGMPYFYIQDPSKPAGIKVTIAKGAEWPEWLEVGKKIRLKGCITWGVMKNRFNMQLDLQWRLDKPCGERVISAFEITDAGATGTVEPLGVTNKDVSAGSSEDPWFTNPGAAGSVGVHTEGMVVRTWGKVTNYFETDDGTCFIVIDDGSAVPSYSTMEQDTSVGLCVYTGEDRSDLVGSYVKVTGIAAVRVDYDWDDPTYESGMVMPEAGKNVRWLKPLVNSDGTLDIVPIN